MPTKEKVEENDKMKEKLDQLRVNMEKMSLTRKVRWHRVLIACNYWTGDEPCGVDLPVSCNLKGYFTTVTQILKEYLLLFFWRANSKNNNNNDATHTCAHTHTHTRMHACSFGHMHACTYACAYARMHPMHTHTHEHTYAHMHTHKENMQSRQKSLQLNKMKCQWILSRHSSHRFITHLTLQLASLFVSQQLQKVCCIALLTLACLSRW